MTAQFSYLISVEMKKHNYSNTFSENLIKESHVCQMHWPILTVEDPEYETPSVITPVFKLCGSEWKVTVFPIGTALNSDYMSIHLTSLSNKQIIASYEITMLNQKPDSSNYSWTDPEGVVLFSSVEDGNNVWGCDEFISVDELNIESGFTLHSKLLLEITIEVHKTDGFEYHPSENVVRDEDIVERDILLERAKDDVSSLIKKLTKGRDLDIQKSQEDKIVRSRLKK